MSLEDGGTTASPNDRRTPADVVAEKARPAHQSSAAAEGLRLPVGCEFGLSSAAADDSDPPGRPCAPRYLDRLRALGGARPPPRLPRSVRKPPRALRAIRRRVAARLPHLAISFCRALNIPARYVFGYIPANGVHLPDEPMDFAAWFEAYLDGSWHPFDARTNRPRIGRAVVGLGRDAVDVATIASLGPLTLTNFPVIADPAL